MNNVNEKPGPPDLWFPFDGGLGDVLIRCYVTSFWYELEKARDRTGVLLASVNPYSTELFRWHINRYQLVLQDLSNIYELYSGQPGNGREIQERLFAFAGINWPGRYAPYRRKPPGAWVPTFHAPDYLEDHGHLVFHPFAGLPSRSIKPEAMRLFLEILSVYPGTVYVLSRDFPRVRHGKVAHLGEELEGSVWPGNFVILRNLTVPATLNLIRQASGFIGTHSSLVSSAAYEGIPSLALYPDFLAESFREARSQAAYAKFDHMTCLPFSEITTEAVEKWIENINPNRGPNAPQQSGKSRQLAEWVIREGGKVGVEPACLPDYSKRANPKLGRSGPIRKAEHLPESPFRVWRVDFADCGGIEDSHFARFVELSTGLDSLTNLNLSGTAVSGSGLRFASKLGKHLQHLHLPGGIEKEWFGQEFPHCRLIDDPE